jgi:phage-related protein
VNLEIFKLFGSIFVDNKDANDSIAAVDDNAQKTGKILGGMIGTAAKWGAGIAAGAVVAGAGIFALVSKVSDTASEINDMSVRTGLSTTRLQELKFAAEQSGVGFESIRSAVSKMTMSMGKADEEGKGMALAFEELGVKTTDANGALLDTQTVFDQSLVKLSEMTNETERNALGMQIFGKGFTELNPLVSGGAKGLADMSAQAHKLGLVMSEDAISAGDQFGDSLDAMKATLGGVVAKIGIELMPTFQKMMDWVMAHMPEIQAGISTAFGIAKEVIGTTIDSVKSLTQFFQEHWDIIQPILAGILAGGLTFGIYTLAINAAAIATGIWSTITGIATVVGTAFGAVLAFITSPIGIVVIAIGLLIAAGVLLYKNWETVSDFLKTIWESIKEVASTVFTAIGDFLSSIWDSINTALQGAWNGIKAFFSTVWEGIKFIFFNLTLAGILIKHWDTIKSTVKSVFNGIKDFFSGVWTSIETTISNVWNGIAKTMSGIWDGITGGIKASINVIIGAINGMIRGLNKIKVDVPAWVEKSTGMGDFGINIKEIPLLAKGTGFFSGGMAIVGEQGPELVNLPRGSQVTPNRETENMLNGSGQPEYIQNSIYLDGKKIGDSVSKAQYNKTQNRTRSAGLVL